MRKHTKEVWRDHPTLRGVRVSTRGRVRTCWRRVRKESGIGFHMAMTDEWRDAVACGVSRGRRYRAVCLYTAEPGAVPRHKNYLVHGLVLATFVGPRPPGQCCCHGNGDPADNRLANLRYDTPKGNSADARKHGSQPIGARHGQAKLTEDQVREILAEVCFTTHAVLAKRYGVSRATISYIHTGKAWTHVPRPPILAPR